MPQQNKMIDLLTRKSDGIEVIVWFDRNNDNLYLEVKDQESHDEFMVPIPHDEAMEAFNHPFAYRTPCYVPTVGDRTYGTGNPADYGDPRVHDDEDFGSLA